MMRSLVFLLFCAPTLPAQAPDAVITARANVAAARKVGNRAQLALALEGLADRLEERDDWKAAKPHREEALAICMRAYGLKHWRTRDVQNAIDAAGRIAALPPAQRAKHAQAATARSGAFRAFAEKRHEDAAGQFLREAQLRKGLLGEAHLSVALAVQNAGQAYRLAGSLDNAERLLARAVSLFTRAVGKDHPHRARAIHGLGLARLARKDYGAAYDLFNEALTVRQNSLPHYHLDKAASLLALASVCEARKQWAKAEGHLLIGIAQTRVSAGTRGRQYADVVGRLARSHRAERAAGRAGNERQRGHIERLMDSRQRGGDFAGALALLPLAAEFHEAVDGRDHWRSTDVRFLKEKLTRLAALPAADQSRARRADQSEGQVAQFYHSGEYARALAVAREALATRRELLGPGHPDVANSLHDIGMVLRTAGDFSDAVASLRKALDLRRGSLGDGHPLTAASRAALGQVLVEAGQFVAAGLHLREATNQLEKQAGAHHPAHIAALNNLAMLAQNLSDHDAAEKHIQRAYRLHEEAQKFKPAERTARLLRVPAGLVDPLDGGINWVNNLQMRVYFRVVDGEEVQFVTGILNDPRPGRAKFLNNLGRVRAGRRDLDGAEKTLAESVAVYDGLAGKGRALPRHLGEARATALNSLGLVRMLRKDLAGAEKALKAAFEARKALYGEKHPAYGNALNSLASLAATRGEHEAAEELLRRAVSIQREALGERSMTYVQTSSNHAQALAAVGKLDEGRRVMKAVVPRYRALLAETASIQSEREQLLQLGALRGQLDALLTLAHGPAEESYAPILAWKGMVFARQRRQREFTLAREGGNEEAARLAAELADTARALGRGTPREREGLAARRERLEQRLATLTPEVARRREAEQLTPKQLAAALPKGVVIVDYFGYTRTALAGEREQRVVAHVLRAGAPAERIDLGIAAPIDRAVKAWRTRAVRGQVGGGEELRKLVWVPVEKHLKGAKVVLVSPDGALAGLPFGALPGAKEGTYLVEELAIASAPVPQELPSLLAPARKAPGAPSLLLLGDVDFDAPAGEGGEGRLAAGMPNLWSGLPGTRAELVGVRAAFEKRYPFPTGQTTVLAGARATEPALFRFAPGHRWLHFATHGYFAPPQDEEKDEGAAGHHPGVLSGLVLAGANRPPTQGRDDGALTALEVATLDLSACELAALSACETGLGKVAGGEGVLGLQRAFHVAGARAVVASLWSVPDDPTRVLMERFYGNLWGKKMGRLDALREAQLWMLKSGRDDAAVQRGMRRRGAPKARKDGRLPPFYWAAFVLSGDWR